MQGDVSYKEKGSLASYTQSDVLMVQVTKFLISTFLITKFLITKFLITKFVSNKVSNYDTLYHTRHPVYKKYKTKLYDWSKILRFPSVVVPMS